MANKEYVAKMITDTERSIKYHDEQVDYHTDKKFQLTLQLSILRKELESDERSNN